MIILFIQSLDVIIFQFEPFIYTSGRKNREGNNAFLRDPQKSEDVDDDITRSCFRRHFEYSALSYLEAYQGIDRDVPLQYYGQVNNLIRQGNYRLAGQLIEQMQKKGVQFGFNQLHVDVLKAKPVLTAYKSTSVTKKTKGSFNIQQKKEDYKILRYWLNYLMYNQKQKRHWCYSLWAQHGHLDCVNELVEVHDQLEWPGPYKSTPIILAAQHGHYDIVEYLLQKNAKINKKDKFRKSALSQAVINGYLRVAALLLQKGADQELPDSSNNYPLHYAAAYGFYECLDILIQAGADVNVKNFWNLTPLSVPYRKDTRSYLENYLERNDIDEKHSQFKRQSPIKKLQSIQKADVNITDFRGRAAIHYTLASEDKIDQVQLLIDNGADINLTTKNQDLHLLLPYQVKFQGHPNFDLLAKDKDGKNILSQLISKDAFYDAEYGCSIILEIAKEFQRDVLEQYNQEGFNIMHELLVEFFTTANAFSQVLLRKKIKQLLSSQYFALREEKNQEKKKRNQLKEGRKSWKLKKAMIIKRMDQKKIMMSDFLKSIDTSYP
ncbi:hypothetical protein pb186bvf_020880 [Paramecium bursaria]